MPSVVPELGYAIYYVGIGVIVLGGLVMWIIKK